MKVSELYSAPQGEGPCLGVPSVFVRLAMCNQTCVWCDTRFTWDKTHPEFKYATMQPTTLADAIINFGIGHVVFTGGEPMLQYRELEQVMELLGYDYLMEVETAGTYPPTEKMERLVHQWNVSPKLSNSGNAVSKRDVPDVMRKFAKMHNAWFKFVIKGNEDVDEVVTLKTKYSLVSSHIILMPEGIDSAESLKSSRLVSEMAMAMGFRFTPRLHILMHGSERRR